MEKLFKAMLKICVILIFLILLICNLLLIFTKSTDADNINVKCFNLIGIDKLSGNAVVFDRDTRVMYVISRGTYNRGTFTLLVNADGTPRIYKDNKDNKQEKEG